jgi:hypothetical protein
MFDFRTVRQEIIWGNQHIKFKNKSLIYLNWINDGIIFINDIIDHKMMKCKFEHMFNTNSISEFLPPFHEASRMFFDIFIHYVWSFIYIFLGGWG